MVLNIDVVLHIQTHLRRATAGAIVNVCILFYSLQIQIVRML